MKYIFVPDTIAENGVVTLKGEEYHYLTRVLRVRPGFELTGRDNSGFLHELEVIRVDDTSCTLSKSDGTKKARIESELPDITLYQGILKGRKMDLVVRQAVEVGTTAVVPVVCERSVPEYEDAGKKVERWRRIVREACQQSGAATVTEVFEPIGFEELIHLPSNDRLCLFFHEEPLARSALDQRTLHGYLSRDPKCTVVLIGPEGGLARHEVQTLLQNGFNPVCLRSNVLRAETAALYALAAVQTVLTERLSWRSNDP